MQEYLLWFTDLIFWASFTIVRLKPFSDLNYLAGASWGAAPQARMPWPDNPVTAWTPPTPPWPQRPAEAPSPAQPLAQTPPYNYAAMTPRNPCQPFHHPQLNSQAPAFLPFTNVALPKPPPLNTYLPPPGSFHLDSTAAETRRPLGLTKGQGLDPHNAANLPARQESLILGKLLSAQPLLTIIDQLQQKERALFLS